MTFEQTQPGPSYQMAIGQQAYEVVAEASSSSWNWTTRPIPIPFLQPRKTPKPATFSLSPPKDIDNGSLLCGPRTSSSPKLRNTHRQRARASSAPSVYRLPSISHRPAPAVQQKSLPDLSSHGHGLGLIPNPPQHHSHHGYRIQELKEGDGQLQLIDAVVPGNLPRVSICHFHRSTLGKLFKGL
jgi:hypothetical protein